MEICKWKQSVCFSNVSCAWLKEQQQHFSHFDNVHDKSSLKVYLDTAGGQKCSWTGSGLHGGRAQVHARTASAQTIVMSLLLREITRYCCKSTKLFVGCNVWPHDMTFHRPPTLVACRWQTCSYYIHHSYFRLGPLCQSFWLLVLSKGFHQKGSLTIFSSGPEFVKFRLPLRTKLIILGYYYTCCVKIFTNEVFGLFWVSYNRLYLYILVWMNRLGHQHSEAYCKNTSN